MILSAFLSPRDAAREVSMVDDRVEFHHDPIPSCVSLHPVHRPKSSIVTLK